MRIAIANHELRIKELKSLVIGHWALGIDHRAKGSKIPTAIWRIRIPKAIGIDGLEKHKLVKCVSSENDRRVKLIEATSKAYEIRPLISKVVDSTVYKTLYVIDIEGFL